ncbi:predicted protein [Phaeodactylum tricornutum CCAP 1055/1]|jgi:hypothetical protein|uniref:Uncharacterized protein n=1 Tax=Phaeodactylum tricornutum (strain CCAP 1055/1) TaxID=556484 RepID=B7FT92_PHATC|nr:predicted protein [Phaeodactylum tricornutum CCAP 1055/1]EEC50615.1 predicted protein [Phaeodactylum tricornutum CCAP 1055/1]|eukprot:XP_002177801.1 predicted protein [Phaeodactylum tricornutum CCAP 1055/1]
MQRRQASSYAPTKEPSPSRITGKHTAVRTKPRVEGGISSGALIVIAVVLTLATFLFPSEMNQVEQEAGYLAQKAEHDLMDWVHRDGGSSQVSSSKWVDGEKRLKVKLKELADRQAKGLDIGVPVLTRYLGEDIPAWPDATITKEAWNAKVAEKYAEMSREEEEWRAKVAAVVSKDQRG